MERGVMVRRAAMLAVCVMLAADASVFGQTAPPQPAGATEDVRVLTPGAAAIERELAGGGVHSYRITLTAGQFLRVEVEQRGIDVILVFRGPDGTQLVEWDGYIGLVGTEEVVWQAAEGGVHVLEVRARARSANSGRYRARIQMEADAGARGQARVAAQRLFMEGRRAQREGSGEGLESASQAYAASVEWWRGAGEQRLEAVALLNLGNVHASMSQYERARDYYDQALLISREIRDRQGEGATLNNLGNAYRNLTQYERARGYYEQALIIRRELHDRQGEAGTLLNLGTAYRSLSQYDRAGDYFEQALVIQREIMDRQGERLTLNNLGNTYAMIKQYERAREYYEQSLAIGREERDRRGEGIVLYNIGIISVNLSQYERAREHYEQALVIMREVRNRQGEGATLMGLGNVHASMSQYERARDYYDQALLISREVRDRSIEANTLHMMARLAYTRGDLAQARAHSEAALAIVESIRGALAGAEARASYLAAAIAHYSIYIDVLMRLHEREPQGSYATEALEASERSRARSLLDLLTETRADIRQGVDPRLVERERTLQRQLNLKAAAQQRLLSAQHTPEQATTMEREVATLTGEYQNVRAQIRRTSPRYAALTQPQPLTVREIQTQVLDPETLLLEYSLGEERSYLWAVTQNSVTSFVLPRRAEVEAAARRVYELLTARQPRPGEAIAVRQRRIAEAEAEYARAAGALSRMLIAPAASLLPRFRRVVVVADGALNYVPFAALPQPAASGGENLAALVETHEIINLPSASTLAVLRRETQGRQPAARAVAVVADPVFTNDDERVRAAGGTSGTTPVRQQPVAARGTQTQGQGVAATTTSPRSDVQLPEGLARSLETTRGGDSGDGSTRTNLARLIFSRREAEAIYASAPRGAALRALDFQANRQTVTSPELSQYRYVHFATHGLLNSQRPELSGVVLSLVDEQGQPQDGFLRLHEVYNLNLPAELVVLSACQTGLGQEVRGEGLVGLTRGFMYAGARRVVASLWQVDDLATSELMRRFYTKMLREGMTPAAALRAAQVEMRQQRQWRSPYHWAGFVLQGEWR